MKKMRRILEVLLVLNFFCGMKAGMRIENVALIMANDLLVIVLAVKELRDGGKKS